MFTFDKFNFPKRSISGPYHIPFPKRNRTYHIVHEFLLAQNNANKILPNGTQARHILDRSLSPPQMTRKSPLKIFGTFPAHFYCKLLGIIRQLGSYCSKIMILGSHNSVIGVHLTNYLQK